MSEVLRSYRSADALLVAQCTKLYPSVLRKVYQKTRPKLKLQEIVAEDDWRYEQLPKALIDANHMTKEQLSRLVKWKITHGVHRPFLPSQVEKNTDAEVNKYTKSAADQVKLLSRNDARFDIADGVLSALKSVTDLKGVGPATGSLLLSCFNPSLIPFFEDELFAWLVPDHPAKLKYNQKEYEKLLNRALKIILKHNICASDLEKTAYVIMHADHLDQDQSEGIRKLPKGNVDSGAETEGSVGTEARNQPSKSTKKQPRATEDEEAATQKQSKRRKIR